MNSSTRLKGAVFSLATDYSYKYLVFSLLLLMVLYPFVEKYSAAQLILSLLMLFTLVSAAWAASRTRRQFLIVGLAAVLVLIGRWTIFFVPLTYIALADSLLALAFFVYVSAIVFKDIFAYGDRVTIDTIYQSIGVYLLLGMTWAFAYVSLELFAPGSFTIGIDLAVEKDLNLHRFIYYSFVTMTTLGYGDITPVTPAAGSLSYVQAVVGQIYLTVLVARLVGMHISARTKQSD